MTTVVPPHLTRSELLDASIVFAKRHTFAILRVTLPALVPAVLFDVALELLSRESDVALLAIPASFLLWGIVEGMALAAAWQLLHGDSTTASRSWYLVSHRALAVAVGYTIKWLLIMIGLLLLIVPGFYLIGRWFAVPTVSIAERATLRDAFRRSRQLTRQDLKRVLWTLGIVELGLMVLSFGSLALVPGASIDSPSVVQTLSYWLVGILVLPFRAGLTALLYLDIRMRREGYDLQLGLSGLDGAA